MTAPRFDWEPGYGFTATERSPVEELAAALEMVRRGQCAYGSVGDQTCDCKYGGFPGESGSSERTGCPELREVIHRLLYRPWSFTQPPLEINEAWQQVAPDGT